MFEPGRVGQVWRQDPDDRITRRVQGESAAKDVGIAAETRLPEVVAQRRDPRGSGKVFFGEECAAQKWPDTKEREEIRGHDPRSHPLGATVDLQDRVLK